MKLINKKTGEIIDVKDVLRASDDYPNHYLIRDEWEDYEEPKNINEIDIVLEAIGEYCNEHSYYSGDLEKIKILNIAEEKLKAFKRLKDKGFRFKDYTRKFDGFKRVGGDVFITAELNDEGVIGMIDELNICFGGEE